MSAIKTFQSPDLPLSELLANIAKGKVQLPDFQRGWVWDDEHVRSLLASISLSYPIGAVMLLETGGEDVKFKPRLIEGVDIPEPYPEPDLLILDGQQRLTSLFTALVSGRPVATRDAKKKPVNRWYYIDMARALDLNDDRDEVVFSIREDRINKTITGHVLLDLSTPEQEYAQLMFPMRRILDSSSWRKEFNKHWSFADDKVELFDRFEEEVIKRFEQYQIPGIQLVRDTPKVAVCQVFEKVNTGGVSLNVFELLTATFAADDFNLRDDWAVRRKTIVAQPQLKSVESTDFLQVIALLKTRELRTARIADGTPEDQAPGVSCKRKDILGLSLDDYRRWADAATQGLMDASRLLLGAKIFDARDLPYRTQLVPLAAVLASLGNAWKADGVKGKLNRWYWCGVFGEMYGGTTESRFAKDLPELLEWISGGAEPDTVKDANFSPDRLLTLRTRNSAAYKGIHAILMLDGACDFVSTDTFEIQTYFADKVDIHHIFPQAWCTKVGIDRGRYDSVINKSPLSAETNRMIGGKAPSEYLERVKKKAGVDDVRLDAILTTHLIDPTPFRTDDFDAFFEHRRVMLLERISKAMGKSLLVEIEPEALAPELDEAFEYEFSEAAE